MTVADGTVRLDISCGGDDRGRQCPIERPGRESVTMACARQSRKTSRTRRASLNGSTVSVVEAIPDMPDRMLNNLLGFLRQNGGQLSNRAQEREFAALTSEEVSRIQELYAETFEGGTSTREQ